MTQKHLDFVSQAMAHSGLETEEREAFYQCGTCDGVVKRSLSDSCIQTDGEVSKEFHCPPDPDEEALIEESRHALGKSISQMKMNLHFVGEKFTFIKTPCNQSSRVCGSQVIGGIMQVNDRITVLTMEDLMKECQAYSVPNVNAYVHANFNLDNYLPKKRSGSPMEEKKTAKVQKRDSV